MQCPTPLTTIVNQGFEKIVLFTGRLTYQKDLFTLFNAAKIVLEKMPKVLFLIAGDGEQKNKLKLLSQKLGISGNIIFKGEIPRDQMPEYFSACDVFVLTSLYEGYPRVLIEASASRKPIVTTDFTSAEDIVRDGKTGFIVRIRDAKAVADRINRLLYNPGLSVEMGNNGFRHIQEIFDEKKILNDLIMMWRATAKAKK